MGDIACFSFYPGKNLGAYGDGGAIVTNNKKLFRKIELIHNMGAKVKHKHKLVELIADLILQAAILLNKLSL